MSAGRRHLGRVALLLVLIGLVVPTSAVHPATLSLTRIETAEKVDFADGVVWLLALGSDARPGEDVTDARVDAVQLVGLDLERGRAVGIGIPRDYYFELPDDGDGDGGFGRFNELTDPERAAAAVEDLTGITPSYVLVTRFEGFRAMVDAIGGLVVRSDTAFTDPYTGITVQRGPNSFDGEAALDYTRSRRLVGDDFRRSANQQLAMLAILRGLVAGEDEAGFLERGALAAITGLQTDLSPIELYRLAQAVTQVRPDQVTSCVLPGDPDEIPSGASVVVPRFEEAARMGEDATDNLRLDRPCWLTPGRPRARG